MNKLTRIAAGGLLASVAVPSLAASIQNPGFEAGDASGWKIEARPSDSVKVTAHGGLSGGHALAITSNGTSSTDVSQTVTGLASGQYTLTAFFRNTGGQEEAILYAKDCGGPSRQTSVPVSAKWIKVVVRGVQASSGRCTIGLHSRSVHAQALAMDDLSLTPESGPAYTFLQGGDLSRLSYIESLGAKFYEGGVQKDPMKILADNGFNLVRLRAYNDPGNPDFSPAKTMPRGFEATPDILKLAKRANAVGMGVELTLNYSDIGADSCRQDVPHAWVGMSFDQIKKALYDYTFDIVKKMKDQGTPPAMVSLGNQMQCGLLLSPGNYGSIKDWSRLAQLLNAGAKAVRAASPTSKIILHLDSPASAQSFFDEAVKNSVDFDMIGLSWYPYWEYLHKSEGTQTFDDLLPTLNRIADRYNKDILILEVGYNWSPKSSGGYKGQLESSGKVHYPETPAGQRDFLYRLINLCKSVDNGRCIGIQYWDPIAVNQPNFGWTATDGHPDGSNSNDNATLFDWKHEPLPALTQAFKNNR